ncbi:unnamed protein product, partial [Nesidiocoris tenuis]
APPTVGPTIRPNPKNVSNEAWKLRKLKIFFLLKPTSKHIDGDQTEANYRAVFNDSARSGKSDQWSIRNRWLYLKMSLPKDAFIQGCFYPRMHLSKDACTQRCFYPRMPLYKDASIQGCLYPRMLLSKDVFIQEFLYPRISLSKYAFNQGCFGLKSNDAFIRGCPYPRMTLSKDAFT